jgi:ABC-2 type transport system ATP-binding protein
MSIISVEDVTKNYGTTQALRGPSFTVDRGEVFGFLGPNGAGKTTLINMLLGLTRPTAGQARVFDLDVGDHGRAIRQRTGVLPEGFRTYDRLTGRRHIEFVEESKGVEADADALLDRVGLLEDADQRAGAYSKGNAQRLLLAMALVGDPDLLILDEPTTGLDPNGARMLREVVRAENDRGATVFFSSHILSQVEAVCDRVGVLQNGQMVAVDTVDQLRENVGAGQTLTATVDALDEQAAEALAGDTNVQSVTTEAAASTVTVRFEGSKMDVLEAIEDRGMSVEDFSVEEASLDDVFQSYVEGEHSRTEVEQ